jgi:hypothetical protein
LAAIPAEIRILRFSKLLMAFDEFADGIKRPFREQLLFWVLVFYATVHFSLIGIVGMLVTIGNVGVFSTHVLVLFLVLLATTLPSGISAFGLYTSKFKVRELIRVAATVMILIAILTVYAAWDFISARRDYEPVGYALFNIMVGAYLFWASANLTDKNTLA